ncbi:TPA: hypothetical protein JLN31_000893 [Escherichia coli]|nr:hypothetical protein [Escherichia coli]
MPVVYSSCTADNFFPVWKGHARKDTYEKGVLIKGGANAQNKRTMITPRGAATVVTAEELELLRADPAFQGFVDRGFMSVDEKGKSTHDADEKGADLEKDKSAQDTPEDYAKMGKKAPKEEK